MLTKKMLMDMPDGNIFAKGEIVDSPAGVNMVNSGRMLKWMAKRGSGYHDWTIYLHWATSDWDYIEDYGDKPIVEANIKKLVPCDDEAYGLFRR